MSLKAPYKPPALAVSFKPADAESRPQWGYESIPPHDGVHVHYCKGGSPTPETEVEADIDNLWVMLRGLHFADVRAVRPPGDRMLCLELDTTTGPGDVIRMRLDDRLARAIVNALTRALERG
jgi:hypothetical protein